MTDVIGSFASNDDELLWTPRMVEMVVKRVSVTLRIVTNHQN